MMKIGILSGYGAAAGSKLLNDFINKCQKIWAANDSDFPEILLYSMASFGMDEKGVANEKILLKDLESGIELLNSFDVDTIIMACNTIHVYHSHLQKLSKAEIVNMPQITVSYCNGYKCGVLSSRDTKKNGLYKGILTTEKQQVIVDKIIDHIISGDVRYDDRVKLEDIIQDMLKRGAERVIFGCTELPLVFNNDEPNKFIIDAGECVVDYVAYQAYSSFKEQENK